MTTEVSCWGHEVCWQRRAFFAPPRNWVEADACGAGVLAAVLGPETSFSPCVRLRGLSAGAGPDLVEPEQRLLRKGYVQGAPASRAHRIAGQPAPWPCSPRRPGRAGGQGRR